VAWPRAVRLQALVSHRLVLDLLFLVKLDAYGLKVLKFWGGVAVVGFVAYVAYLHIGASNYRHNAEQQIAKCELKGMDTHAMGMKLTLAYCMQAAGNWSLMSETFPSGSEARKW